MLQAARERAVRVHAAGRGGAAGATETETISMTPPDRDDLLHDLRAAREHVAGALYAASHVKLLDRDVVEAMSRAEALLAACVVLATKANDRTVRRRTA